ncbi:DUF4304 domain-containing protein [Mesorhizobium sp. M0854]|uniref:DUF4304 domain-containing protein n=1 Tax=Mesorhizobium sp. M0854 TaxID=2957013 RepID=UPI003337E849
MERELPKQVFIDGCKQISMEFEPIGFRFAKTGPHASRRAGDWAFKISFQSNYLNVGGEYVELVVHASVYSKAIKEWDERSAWPASVSDWVAGGQLGNLRTPHHWRTWNIANPHTRQAEIANIVANIQTTVLPLFERFDVPRKLAEQVACSEVPGFMFPEMLFDLYSGSLVRRQRKTVCPIGWRAYLRRMLSDQSAMSPLCRIGSLWEAILTT